MRELNSRVSSGLNWNLKSGEMQSWGGHTWESVPDTCRVSDYRFRKASKSPKDKFKFPCGHNIVNCRAHVLTCHESSPEGSCGDPGDGFGSSSIDSQLTVGVKLEFCPQPITLG